MDTNSVAAVSREMLSRAIVVALVYVVNISGMFIAGIPRPWLVAGVLTMFFATVIFILEPAIDRIFDAITDRIQEEIDES